MFISTFELFKLGIGPSSSHTLGPLIAARAFRSWLCCDEAAKLIDQAESIQCRLMGSLAFTGKGHFTDRGVLLGLHDFTPDRVLSSRQGIEALFETLKQQDIVLENGASFVFNLKRDLIFDCDAETPAHPNTLSFNLLDAQKKVLFSFTRCSVGGGFVSSPEQLSGAESAISFPELSTAPYPFQSAKEMLEMAQVSGKSIAQMKRENEVYFAKGGCEKTVAENLRNIWSMMRHSIESGLEQEGVLPGGLNVQRRAASLYSDLKRSSEAEVNDWMCAYAMAVNEENAAGRMVVTAPTNGAAGVIPAVFYFYCQQGGGKEEECEDYLLTAAAIGGLIKHKSSISGAEVGCQGEVGSAAAMAAAGLCAVKGGTPAQIENAAEIALEHHLGMTCDPVQGLVQVPCIERNGFGAMKAYTAASLARKGSGSHYISLDRCISAMNETGREMSHKYKETALGGLAQSWTEC